MPAPPAAAASPAAALNIAANASALDALYPCSDGKPMAESISHGQAIMAAAGDLEAARPDALVAADVLVYPEEGNPDNRIAPDVLAAFGLEKRRDRSSYLTWLEGKPPDWVLEVASPATARNDLRGKRHAYAAMGVPEYWLFDPTGELYPRGQRRLQGLALADGKYEPLEERVEGGLRLIRSRVLGLDLRTEGRLLRFRDPATGKDVRHRDEEAERANREAAGRRAEAAGRRAAEARAEREAAERRAEAAGRRAAEARAEREAAGRRAAQARVAELEAALRRALRRSRTDSSGDRQP